MAEIDVLKVIWDVSMLIRNLSEEIKNLKFGLRLPQLQEDVT